MCNTEIEKKKEKVKELEIRERNNTNEVVFNKDYVVVEKDNGSIQERQQVVVEKDNKNTNKNTNKNKEKK